MNIRRSSVLYRSDGTDDAPTGSTLLLAIRSSFPILSFMVFHVAYAGYNAAAASGLRQSFRSGSEAF
jgi:hypothetical protein